MFTMPTNTFHSWRSENRRALMTINIALLTEGRIFHALSQLVDCRTRDKPYLDSQVTVLRSGSSEHSFDGDQAGPSTKATLVTCRRMIMRSGKTAPNLAETFAVSPG